MQKCMRCFSKLFNPYLRVLTTIKAYLKQTPYDKGNKGGIKGRSHSRNRDIVSGKFYINIIIGKILVGKTVVSCILFSKSETVRIA